MVKVTLKEIYKYIFSRSTLIAIPNLNELFELNEKLTKYEVFFSIVDNALKEFEKWVPLYIKQKVWIQLDQYRRFTFESNFDAYLDGKIIEDDIILVPSAIVGFSLNPYNTYMGTYIRNFDYRPPTLYEFWYGNKIYWIECICNRPLIEEYDEKSKDYTDRCAIYFMAKVGSEYKYFLDQVYLEVCRYIVNLRKNLGLTNMPIELFQGLEEDMSKLENKLETYYMQSQTTGFYLK